MSDKGTTPFTPPMPQPRGGPQEQAQEPVIHPSVAGNPEALAYAAGLRGRLQERRQQAAGTAQPPSMSGLQKYTTATPGAPPAMPPLEAEHRPGLTMEQQAAMHGQSPEQRAQEAARQQNSIVDGSPQPIAIGSMAPGASRNQQLTPAQLGILNTDVLPEEATQDPAYRPGQGAIYAVNQPEMALRYGVIRNKQRIPPQALQANTSTSDEPRIGNRPMQKTLQDLQALSSAQKPPEGLPRTEQEADTQAGEGPGSASQNAGRPPSQEETQKALQKLDDFDFDSLRKQMNRDVINNSDQRKIIEERLEPLSLDQLIVKDFVTQTVPIVPGKFSVTYQSLSGEVDTELKRLLMLESNQLEVTDRYLLDKFAIMSLTAGTIAINNNPLPSHLDDSGVFNEDRFWAKFNWMLKRPIHMLAAIGTNHTWFEIRVRRLFVTENVKNG